jgi:hypothetical protein
MVRAQAQVWHQLSPGQRVISKLPGNVGTVVSVISMTDDGVSKMVMVRWDCGKTLYMWSTRSLVAVDENTPDRA